MGRQIEEEGARVARHEGDLEGEVEVPPPGPPVIGRAGRAGGWGVGLMGVLAHAARLERWDVTCIGVADDLVPGHRTQGRQTLV